MPINAMLFLRSTSSGLVGQSPSCTRHLVSGYGEAPPKGETSSEKISFIYSEAGGFPSSVLPVMVEAMDPLRSTSSTVHWLLVTIRDRRRFPPSRSTALRAVDLERSRARTFKLAGVSR